MSTEIISAGGQRPTKPPPPSPQRPDYCPTQRPSQCPAKILSLRAPARDSTFDKEAPEGPSPKQWRHPHRRTSASSPTKQGDTTFTRQFLGIKDPSITHSAHETKPSRLTTNPVVGLLILDMPQLSSARSLHNQLISIKFVANCLFHACLCLAPHSRHNQSRHQEHKPCRTTSMHVRDADGTPPSDSSCAIMRAPYRAQENSGKTPNRQIPTDRRPPSEANTHWTR